MKLQILDGKNDSLKSDLYIRYATVEDIQNLDKFFPQNILDILNMEDFTGKEGQLLRFLVEGMEYKYITFVGIGKKDEFEYLKLQTAVKDAINDAKKIHSVKNISIGICPFLGAPEITAEKIGIAALLTDYSFDKYKTKSEDDEQKELTLLAEEQGDMMQSITEGYRKAQILACSVNMTRDMINEPPVNMTPAILAEKAQNIADKYDTLTCEVWDEKRLAEENMGCLLAVGRGSVNPPRLIKMTYTPRVSAKSEKWYVGKGLCYDSGGLNIKPGNHMNEMKSDMSGGASVISMMEAVAKLEPAHKIVAMVPTCENMPSGNSYKADDIMTARNGKTVEIDNTDAEGRLALADALSLAAESTADTVIDIATLTGGALYALSDVWTPVLGNDQALIDELMECGERAGERMWQLPMHKKIRAFLDSKIADIKNCSTGGGSTLQGAEFLKEFVGDKKWAHLDIAITSFNTKNDDYLSEGATGVMVRTLIEHAVKCD